MAQSKRSKSTGNDWKKKATAKQALKKKHLSSNKSRNDELREKLDREALCLHTLRKMTDPRPDLELPTMDVTESSLTDLTAILRKL